MLFPKDHGPLVTSQIEVERLFFQAMERVGVIELTAMRNAELTSWADHHMQAICYQVSTFIDRTLAEKVTLELRAPSSWWQHFKQTFFPQWLVKRFPVDYTVQKQEVQTYKVCPHGAISGKDYRGTQAHLAFLSGEPNVVRTPPQPQPLQPLGRRSRHRPNDWPGEAPGYDFNRID